MAKASTPPDPSDSSDSSDPSFLRASGDDDRLTDAQFERQLNALRTKVAPVLAPISGSLVPPTRAPLADRALFEQLLAYQDALGEAFPTSLTHRVSVPVSYPIAVAFPSDWHIGSAGTDLRRIQADCELIARHPRLYVSLGGDPVDNFIFSKMASAARTQSAQVHVQWRIFRYLVESIQDSLLWVSSGNHDAWTHSAAGIDGVLAALAGIPVVYTGEGGLITLNVGPPQPPQSSSPPQAPQSYAIYRKHRPTRWKSGYNPTHFLKQMLRMGAPWDFDVGISEHFHEASFEVMEWRPGSGIDRVMVTCGSYKIHDSWAESGGFYGGGYGVPTLVFHPETRKIVPFLRISDAITYLDGTVPPAVRAHARRRRVDLSTRM